MRHPECRQCGERRKGTALCAVPLEPCDVGLFLLCPVCARESRHRTLANQSWRRRHARWAREDASAPGGRGEKEDEEEGVTPLWRRALKGCGIGVVNRAPFLSAERLGRLLDKRSKGMLVTLLLEYSGISDGAFAAFIRESGWAAEPTAAAAADAADADKGSSAPGLPGMTAPTPPPAGKSWRLLALAEEAKQEEEAAARLGGAEDEEEKAREEREEQQRLGLAGLGVGQDELGLLEYFCSTLSVSELDLSQNRLGQECAALVGDIVHHDRCVAVNCSWNRLGLGGARALGAALRSCSRLTSLRLAANGLGPDAAAALAAALRDNESLEELDVGFNRMLAEGAGAFARALESNRRLAVLNIRSNSIGPDGAFALAHAMRVGVPRKIVVVDNEIGPEGAEQFAKYFRGSIKELFECIQGSSGARDSLCTK